MESEPARRNELWSAILSVFGSEPPNAASLPTYQQAARDLWQSGATPQEVARRAELMRRTYTVPLTPTMLAKNWGTFAPRKSPASGLWWHPDRCPSPCIGCAADRKARP